MRIARALSLLSALLLSLTAATAQETDPDTGLIVGTGWREVAGTCTECHSPLLITQNAGNKAVWRSRIRWMQETQGLQILPGELEETILDYLSTHYGEKAPSRRPPLPESQLPANPYPTLNDDD
ncbi:MAG: hypothetical protein WD396_09045 [Pseudohongiellaceae bacterium]